MGAVQQGWVPSATPQIPESIGERNHNYRYIIVLSIASEEKSQMTAKASCGIAVLLATVILAAGCGESKDKAPASQTAAKVNGDEVTVHQINAELQRATRGAPLQGANAEAASKRILEGLIDQTLLVQQAKEAKLDRDPTVLQALESARRQILAQAYIDRQAAASPPTQDEIKAFYAKNPDLFEQWKKDTKSVQPHCHTCSTGQIQAVKEPESLLEALSTAWPG